MFKKKAIPTPPVVDTRAYLISIERNGRLNVFTFQRGDKIITIECMGLLGDDVATWRNELL